MRVQLCDARLVTKASRFVGGDKGDMEGPASPSFREGVYKEG